MSQPRHLRLRDVRDVFRLIGEVREQGADPKVWRRHMVKRLRALFSAEIVVSSEVHAQTTRTPGKLRMIDIGWGCDTEENVWDIHSEREDENPEAWRNDVWMRKLDRILATTPESSPVYAQALDEARRLR